MSKRFLIKELFNLSNEQYEILRKRMSEVEILNAHKKFNQGVRFQQITALHLYYFIDDHGDFVNHGKLKPYHVARAVYNSMNAHDKIDILEYIDENH